MKKTFAILAVLALGLVSYAQDAETAVEAAASAIENAPAAAPAKPKASEFWTESLKSDITFGQTNLWNWAAGGDNTISLGAHIDGNANYKKDAIFWNNRLQLDYGFLWASSKPITQKNNDRIYLESKFGYQVTDKLYISANYDFRTQFAMGYAYNTPATKYAGRVDASGAPVLDADGNQIMDEVALTRQDWRDARNPLSNFLAPAYTNLALGIDYKPAKWLSINFAPLTGSYTIVKDANFRKSYGMYVRKENRAEGSRDAFNTDAQTKADAINADASLTDAEKAVKIGELYMPARFAFGAQLKIDAAFNINDNFSYTTQLVLFEDYLKDHKAHPCPRINWDNRISWKLAKYFALTVTTNLIYDDYVMIKTEKWLDNCKDEAFAAANPNGMASVQFMESLSFGFTYTIASKK